MKTKSILILSAAAGAGHVRSAEALAETAKSLSIPIETRHEDILDFTFPIFKKIYSDIQFAVVDRSPELWGYFYKKTEFEGLPKPTTPIKRIFNHFNYKRYRKLLDESRPDAVICTHFLPYRCIAEQMKQPEWSIPFFTVTTDYDLHSLWVNPSVKHYYVPTEQALWTLKSHGIHEDSISVKGIPLMPSFACRMSPCEARREMGLSPDKFTIMVLSGGYGTGTVDNVISSITQFLSSESKRTFQLIFVCGKNARLFEALSKIVFPSNVEQQIGRAHV